MSYELVTLLDVSVDTFFFPNKETDKRLRKSKQRAKHEPEHTTEYGMRNAMSPYGL